MTLEQSAAKLEMGWVGVKSWFFCIPTNVHKLLDRELSILSVIYVYFYCDLLQAVWGKLTSQVSRHLDVTYKNAQFPTKPPARLLSHLSFTATQVKGTYCHGRIYTVSTWNSIISSKAKCELNLQKLLVLVSCTFCICVKVLVNNNYKFASFGKHRCCVHD